LQDGCHRRKEGTVLLHPEQIRCLDIKQNLEYMCDAPLKEHGVASAIAEYCTLTQK
jgi:hypothetical protein